MKDIHLIPRADAIIMVVVLLLTVLVDLLQAVAAGMIMSSLWFMKQMSETAHENATGDFHSSNQDSRDAKLYIQYFNGPIFFGFTSGFKEVMSKMPEVEIVVFQMQNVPHIDQSGMYALEEAIISLQKKGIKVYFSGIQTQPKGMFEKISLIPGLVPQENIHEDFEELIKIIKQKA
jgi:SulP family sulfate permease